MSVKCPRCGEIIRTRPIKRGEWVENKEKYDAYWRDKPTELKLAIEDYLFLKDRDWKKFTLRFTSDHNKADYDEVKKAFSDLRAGGMIVAEI